MSVAQISERLEAIMRFMAVNSRWDFVNCHMVSYFTDGHWERYIPEELRLEVPNAQQVQKCIETVFWRNDQPEEDNNFPAFQKFKALSESYRLENFADVLTMRSDLNKLLSKDEAQPQISIKEFLSEKKKHEVEITAELISDLIQSLSNSSSCEQIYVIDAGDGKGYLSSRLALQYHHKVLGIDFQETNTQNALARSQKLQRAWNGLTNRAKLEAEGVIPPRRGKKDKTKNNSPKETNRKDLPNYKTTAKFITPKLDMVQLVREHFTAVPDSPTLCLTGLHTCGNLASTCLEVFHVQPQFRLLCNIGCCYHLLKERYSGPEFFGNKLIMDMQTQTGFPMSKFLSGQQVSLGRNARMLAAQCVERTLAERKSANISLYYRALLEILICKQDVMLKDQVQVGKIRKFETFSEYIALCEKKMPLKLSNLTREIEELEQQYADQRCYLELFYLVRMLFAPILESFILLDRLLYLKELGYEDSFLVSVFDSIISPRHFGIIAIKK